MSPKKMNNSASNSNDRKRSDLLPDLEDLGKVLKTCSSDQEEKPDQSQSPDEKDCQTCDRKDTCETVVQASRTAYQARESISREDTQPNKDQEMVNPTRKPMQQQASKQEPKTTILKTAQRANEGVSTKVAEKAPTLGNAEGPLDNPDAELGD